MHQLLINFLGNVSITHIHLDLTMRYLTRWNNNDSDYFANISLTSQLRMITMPLLWANPITCPYLERLDVNNINKSKNKFFATFFILIELARFYWFSYEATTDSSVNDFVYELSIRLFFTRFWTQLVTIILYGWEIFFIFQNLQ